MSILIIDNYDSFTYNLVQLVRHLHGQEPVVWRNDAFDLEEVGAFEQILLSPGPGVPEEAGLLLPLIRRYAPSKSILGICLGHQAIACAFGAALYNMPRVRHGIASELSIVAPDLLFQGLPDHIEAAHYHSWCVSETGFPEALKVTMRDAEGNIMALRHRRYAVQGLQFHPESILTPLGKQIMYNWIKMK